MFAGSARPCTPQDIMTTLLEEYLGPDFADLLVADIACFKQDEDPTLVAHECLTDISFVIERLPLSTATATLMALPTALIYFHLQFRQVQAPHLSCLRL